MQQVVSLYAARGTVQVANFLAGDEVRRTKKPGGGLIHLHTALILRSCQQN